MTGYLKLSDVTAEYLCPGNRNEGFRQLEDLLAPLQANARYFEICCYITAVVGFVLFVFSIIFLVEGHTIPPLLPATGFLVAATGTFGDRIYSYLRDTLRLQPTYATALPDKVLQILNALCRHNLCARISVTHRAGPESDDRAEDGQPLGPSIPGQTFDHRYAPLLLLRDTKLYRHVPLGLGFCRGSDTPIYVIPKQVVGIRPILEELSINTAALSKTSTLAAETNAQMAANFARGMNHIFRTSETLGRAIELSAQTAVNLASGVDHIAQTSETLGRSVELSAQMVVDLAGGVNHIAQTSETLGRVAELSKQTAVDFAGGVDHIAQTSEMLDRVAKLNALTATNLVGETKGIAQSAETLRASSECNKEAADKLATTSVGLSETLKAAQPGNSAPRSWVRPTETENHNLKEEHRWLVGGTDDQFEIGLKAFLESEFNSDDEMVPIYEMVFWIARDEFKKGGNHGASAQARRQILTQIQDVHGLKRTIRNGKPYLEPRIADSTLKVLLRGMRAERDIKGYFLKNYN